MGQSFIRNNQEKKKENTSNTSVIALRVCVCVCLSVCLSVSKHINTHTHTFFHTSAPLAGHFCSFQRQAFSIRWLSVVLTILCFTFTLIREGCLLPQISSLFLFIFLIEKTPDIDCL